MALDYSVDNLLAMVRDIIFAGSSQRDWDGTRLCRLLNREIGEYMVPLIMRARQNHFVTYADQPLIAGQKLYRLPSKATGMKLRAAQLVDASGNTYQPLSETELETAILVDDVTRGTPEVYFFVGNQLGLRPVPSGTPTLSLRVWFVSRPSTLVLTKDPVTNLENVVAATSFPGGAPAGNFRFGYTATTQPAWAVVGKTLDIVQNKPGFDVLGGFVVNNVFATSVELAGTIPPELVLGDWLCQSDQAPVVTGAIPEIVLGCLIKKVALEATSAKGDQEAFGRIAGLLKLDEQSAVQFLNRRAQGDMRKAGSMAATRFKRGGMSSPW